MSELLEILKVTGPAVAILLWLVIKLWSRNDTHEQTIKDLSNQLLSESKKTSLLYLQLTQTTLRESTPIENITSATLDFLNKKAEELTIEINQIKDKATK